ncbi:MAG: phage major capsid protein [Clostridiales bacterium]|nr:phage major capsid protein [Clostridiales bacterium]
MSELETILKSLDEVGAKINEIDADGKASVAAVKEEMKKLGEEQVKFARELAALQQASADGAAESDNRVKSIGEKFTESANYKAFSANTRDVRGARHIVSTKSDSPTVSTVSPTISRNTIAAPYQLAGIWGAPEQQLIVENLIPHIPVSSSAVEYLKHTGFTNNAGVVAEGAAKAESTFEFDLATANVVTIAHWTKITEQLAADAPAVTAYINAKMMYGLQLKVDNQIISGTGTSTQLGGFLKSGNHTDYSSAVTIPTGANLMDFALLIKTKLDTLGYPPKVLLLNPADWAGLALLKDTQKRYLLGGPAGVTTKSLWGLPVETSASVPSGKYVMADFALGSTIYDRQEVALEIDREGDDFRKNLLTIRVERRLGLGVEDAAAIAGGDWSLGE